MQRIRIVHWLSWLGILGIASLLAAAPRTVTVDVTVSQLLTDDGTLVLVVGKMDDGEKGTWRVKLKSESEVDVRVGLTGHLTGDREVLRTSGPGTVGFKGTDEELQAVVERVPK